MSKMMVIEVPEGYEPLGHVFQNALNQAARGKGMERHATTVDGRTLTLHEQPAMRITRERGVGFAFGQSDKKSLEAQLLFERGDHVLAMADLLGSICYQAFAAVHMAHGASVFGIADDGVFYVPSVEESIRQFLQECTVEVIEGKVCGAEMYSAYQSWCRANALVAVSAIKFARVLSILCVPKSKEAGAVFYLGLELHALKPTDGDA